MDKLLFKFYLINEKVLTNSAPSWDPSILVALSVFLTVVSYLFQLIAECEQVKTERETELINEQVLIAMSEMGLDRERTLQVGPK